MERLAIVSVYDKRGLEPFAKALVRQGVRILSTGGTARYLTERGVSITPISEYTGQKEVFDGRVKTLHPKIHGGILARRSEKSDMDQFSELGILPIDFVVVNLYPFTSQVKDVLCQGLVTHGSLVELIDIGGPTMLRAAAKNCQDVVPVCDPEDYDRLLDEMKKGKIGMEFRRELASKVFRTTAAYDTAVSRYFSLEEKLFDKEGNAHVFAPVEGMTLERKDLLRYGENPHQKAAFYRDVDLENTTRKPLWKQLQGKELSYNNYLDINAALELFLDVRRGFPKKHNAVVIKHTNPCGASLGDSPQEAFERARACDPLSAFGGIVALSGTVDASLADSMIQGFLEVVLASDVTDEACQVFAKKKNIRVLVCDFDFLDAERRSSHLSVRSLLDGYLLQTRDNDICSISEEQVVAGPKPTAAKLDDFGFAWIVCAHVKSNSIVVVKNGQAIGIGAGQMSRVDSAKLSVDRARNHGHDVRGGVAASDAFLPFPDTLEILCDAGVSGLVQPGGSIKDDAVLEVARMRNVTMLFTGERHFRH